MGAKFSVRSIQCGSKKSRQRHLQSEKIRVRIRNKTNMNVYHQNLRYLLGTCSLRLGQVSWTNFWNWEIGDAGAVSSGKKVARIDFEQSDLASGASAVAGATGVVAAGIAGVAFVSGAAVSACETCASWLSCSACLACMRSLAVREVVEPTAVWERAIGSNVLFWLIWLTASAFCI